jgi:hypothetical protein
VQIILDDLTLVHLNDGSHTRIVTPPVRSSAVDLTLCSAGLSLDCTWRVLDDPAISLGSLQIPLLSNLTTPIFDLTRHVSWSEFRDRVLETLHETPKRLSVAERYALFVHIIHRVALAAQVRSPKTGGRYTMLPAVWWDGECEDAKRVKLKAFRVFMKNGIIENYKNIKKRN